MGVLSDLEPKNVFRFFEEITGIPHGSGNVEQISDYLVNFARERNLFCIQDEWKNVIIVKEATPGYEKEPTVILQGHMDMVAVKKPDCDIDMRTEGLRVAVDGDAIYAEGTSLGGDDGIAVAYSLALLDSDSIRHPKLEVILTVDEEVGMDGARAIDLSMLTGNRMINLDSEDEGIFLTSCAGGARVKCRLPLSLEEGRGTVYQVTVGGLLGGHSGGEIHKERGNSNCLFGRLLKKMSDRIPVRLCQVKGGLADNAIPRETTAFLLVEEGDCTAFQQILADLEKEIKGELVSRDAGFYLKAEVAGEESYSCAGAAGVQMCPGEDARGTGTYRCVSAADTRRAADFLAALPNGVQAMSADMPGLVETSLNLGILEFTAAGDRALADCTEAGDGASADCAAMGNGTLAGGPADDLTEKRAVLLAEFSVRSSVESAKHALIGRLEAVTELAGGSNEVTGDYPGWAYRKDSPLRDKMAALYEKMYGTAPRVEAIHAGLECGILGSKIKDLDCVSMGPQMTAIHTTEETLSISSTRRVWEYLVALLEEKD